MEEAPRTFVGPLPPSWRKWSYLEHKCPPNSLYKCPPTTAATAKIGQMSSKHYRQRQMSSNHYQPLPPELVKCPTTTAAKLDKSPPTTTARISQMSPIHCRQSWTNVLPTLPPKPNVPYHYQPLPHFIVQMSSYDSRQCLLL